MSLEATNDYVILKQYEDSSMPFAVPAGSTSELRYKVISVGSKVDSCTAGDIVICYAEPPIKVSGDDYWFTRNDAIIARQVS